MHGMWEIAENNHRVNGIERKFGSDDEIKEPYQEGPLRRIFLETGNRLRLNDNVVSHCLPTHMVKMDGETLSSGNSVID